MSLDLTLLPYNCDFPAATFSHIVLPLQTNSRDLMEEIERLSFEDTQSIDFITGERLTGEVEQDFSCYLSTAENGDTQYGTVCEDAYGNPMRWMRVNALLTLIDHDSVIGNPLNKQAWGYLNACPPNTRVALYWS